MTFIVVNKNTIEPRDRVRGSKKDGKVWKNKQELSQINRLIQEESTRTECRISVGRFSDACRSLCIKLHQVIIVKRPREFHNCFCFIKTIKKNFSGFVVVMQKPNMNLIKQKQKKTRNIKESMFFWLVCWFGDFPFPQSTLIRSCLF